MVSTWGSLKPLLTCFGFINGRQSVPRAELQAFLCFLQRTEGPATYICDAMAVSKGFRRLQQGQLCVSNTNQDLWSAIREAAKQRDIEIHWVASHEEIKIDRVDTTMTWFVGLNTLTDGVAEVAAELCGFPETVPALTSWIEGKSWDIRHRAALTTLDAIDKGPVASLPPPKRFKPTIDDLKLASEHDIVEHIVEHLSSVTCNECGQRAPHRAAFLKRWLKSHCQAGQRVTLPDGSHRIVPLPGQGHLRHQTTHPSHNCTFYPGLDTWICLTCGFYGSDVFKQLAQPCTGTANQAGRDNLSRVGRGLMPGSSKATREFNARRHPV